MHWHGLLLLLRRRKKNCCATSHKRIKSCKNNLADYTDTTPVRINRSCEGYSANHQEFKSQSEDKKVISSTSPQQFPQEKSIYQWFIGFCILRSMFSKLILLPRQSYDSIILSRPVRLFRLLRSEARNHGHHAGQGIRFIDLSLIFKLLFVCYIFTIKLKSRQIRVGHISENDHDIIVTFWVQYRITIFLLCVVIMYGLQTGIVQFLYHVLIKKNGLRMIWRNEDLFSQCSKNETPKEEMNKVNIGQNRNIDDKSEKNIRYGTSLNTMRRGRRDRMVHCHQTIEREDVDSLVHGNEGEHPEFEENIHLPGVLNADGNDSVNVVTGLKRIFMNSFIVGAIHGRRMNEAKTDSCEFEVKAKMKSKYSDMLKVGDRNNGDNNIFTESGIETRTENHLCHLDVLYDFLMDIMYIFGSLFLSLLPMWRPWMVEVVIQEDDEDKENNKNENVNVE